MLSGQEVLQCVTLQDKQYLYHNWMALNSCFQILKSSLVLQGEVTEMKADEEKLEVFEAAVDKNLISLLHDSLNKVPITLSQLKTCLKNN